MAAGQIHTLGKTLERTFVATGEDGVPVTICVMRLNQAVEEYGGNLMPIDNPSIVFQLEGGTPVYASQPEGTFIVDRSHRILVAPAGTYPT